MRTIRYLLLILFIQTSLTAQAQRPAVGDECDITINVTDRDTHEPVIMATVQLLPIGAAAFTDAGGKAVFRCIEAGTYTLKVSYVGYETRTLQLKTTGKPLLLNCQLSPSNLALREVTVTARQNVSGASTSSIIGRQAIDHLQASSLADVMQLIPGHLMTNTDLTSQSNLQIRTLANNNTAAFGSSVIIDGMPVSNNGTVSQGGFSATAFTGTDLRNFSADDIDEVEVIRGIPSAEYGDLTSGMMVVRSKIGVTPWQVKGKVNPGLMNYSLGKGLRLSPPGEGKAGVLNFNIDYAQAWGDPRMKTKSFDRYTLSLGYGFNPSRHWHTDTKVRLLYAKDWNGNDPDARQDGTEQKNLNKVLTLTHNGKIRTGRRFSRNINYTVGLSLTAVDHAQTSMIPTDNGVLNIITARETGYHDVAWLTSPYQATGYTESRPGNVYAKLSNAFYLKSGHVNQRFKMGLDYHYDWNSGAGYYNADETHPLKPNSDGRPRAFSDVPGLHQIAAYAEDNLSWEYVRQHYLRLSAGARFSAMQPFSDVRTFALSPRVNVAADITSWLTLRVGFGLNSKMPGLDYLYPDRKYTDHLALQYYANNSLDPSLYPQSRVVCHTFVQDVAFSQGLKNATTAKTELGADIKLPDNRRLSITVYHDKTSNGFSGASRFVAYESLAFGSVADYDRFLADPAAYVASVADMRPYVYWATTGQVSNDNVLQNKGIEFDFDLGRVNALNTHIFFSGAWQESKSWNKGQNTAVPKNLPTTYKGTTPYRLVYPSGLDYSRDRRFVNTLRLVTSIPELRMVASFTGQVVWHNSAYSYNADKDPYAFLGYAKQTDGSYAITFTPITAETLPMLTAAGIDMDKQLIRPNDNEVTEQPVTWNLSARLTKEFGKVAGLSFYANNVLYYEPFMTTSTSGTLTQRNTGSYSFGVELFFNL